MNIKTALAASLLAASLHSVCAQTQTLYRVTFKATCFTTDSSGQVANTKLTEKDIISHCIGSQGLSTHALARNYALAYDPSANLLRVVRLSDGALLCDVIQFQDVASTSDSRQTDQFAFMFVPDQTNSIGTAIITQKVLNNSNNNANISGKVQFVLTGDLVLGGTNALLGTNVSATTNGLSAAIAAVEAIGNGSTGTSPSGSTNSTGLTATNATSTTGTNVASITGTNVASIADTNLASIISTNLTTVPGTTTTTSDSNTVFTIGTPAITFPPTSVFSTTNSVADTNTITSTDTNSIATNAFATVVDTNLVTTNSVGVTNLTNVRICSGAFTANRRLLVNVSP
jgi:hypothetical protein